jgi:hypothetical protein
LKLFRKIRKIKRQRGLCCDAEKKLERYLQEEVADSEEGVA